MENAQVADILAEIADLLDLKGANAFRIRSYRNAAQTVRNLSHRLEDTVEEGTDLSELPNVGKSTAENIRAILETGTCQRLEELRQEIPEALTSVMNIPGVGPRKTMQLHKELDVNTVGDLKKACEKHRVRELDGMGAKTEEKILEGIAVRTSTFGRMLYKEAAEQLSTLGRHLDKVKTLKRWEVAGSFRRCKETIGDLDILVEASDREKAAGDILGFEGIDDVISSGKERVSVRLQSGLQVDFRFFDPSSFGSALMYFTGSKEHNITLRRRAQSHDWKLNEYGLFQGKKRLAGKSEDAVYSRLELPLIPPELREDRGEIEAAEEGRLPRLVEPDDMRGDLQCHSTASDGQHSVKQMAQAAKRLGYEYLAITDHSKRVTMANGLDDDATRRHADEIRKTDDALQGLWLMAGIEVDVLKSGKLDLKEDTLAELDWVVASIHYDRNMSRKAMTQRMVSAIQSGVIDCIGHPLGRIIGKRKPLEFDIDQVFEACLEYDVWVEINAQPDRLDLPDTYCIEAAEAGIRFTVSTDAHSTSGLDFMPLGVNVARRGWLTRKSIANTRTEKQFRKLLR